MAHDSWIGYFGMDPLLDRVEVTVVGGYDASATEITIDTNDHDNLLPRFADYDEYDMEWWNSTDYNSPAEDPNVEAVRVTAENTTTKTVTVDRAQRDTSASVKNLSGKTYKMTMALNMRHLRDIGYAIPMHPFQFGAKGDDLTDDTQALKDLATACAAISPSTSGPGVVVNIPYGHTFKVTDEIVFDCERIKITGGGRIRGLNLAAGKGILKLSSGGNSCCVVEHLELFADGSTEVGLWVDHHRVATIASLYIKNDLTTRTGQTGVIIEDGAFCTKMQGCQIHGTFETGLEVRRTTSSANGFLLEGGWFNRSAPIHVVGQRAIYYPSGSTASHNRLHYCYFDGWELCIDVDGPAGITVMHPCCDGAQRLFRSSKSRNRLMFPTTSGSPGITDAIELASGADDSLVFFPRNTVAPSSDSLVVAAGVKRTWIKSDASASLINAINDSGDGTVVETAEDHISDVVTISASTTVAVSFDTDVRAATYGVWLTPLFDAGGEAPHVTGRTVSGFTINFQTSQTGDIAWRIQFPQL